MGLQERRRAEKHREEIFLDYLLTQGPGLDSVLISSLIGIFNSVLTWNHLLRLRRRQEKKAPKDVQVT